MIMYEKIKNMTKEEMADFLSAVCFETIESFMKEFNLEFEDEFKPTDLIGGNKDKWLIALNRNVETLNK